MSRIAEAVSEDRLGILSLQGDEGVKTTLPGGAHARKRRQPHRDGLPAPLCACAGWLALIQIQSGGGRSQVQLPGIQDPFLARKRFGEVRIRIPDRVVE